MKSVKCPECGFVGWADAERCKKCGVIRLPDPGGDSYEPTPLYPYQASNPYSVKLKTGLAVTALVIGIVDLFTLGMLGVGAIVGITISIVALSKAKRNPHEYGGQGMATAGLVMSILSLAVIIVRSGIVAGIVVPNLLASRRAANEGATLSTLRRIQSAQETYQATTGEGQFGTLEQLVTARLVHPALADGKNYGYKFTVRIKEVDYADQPGFEAVAVPETYGSSGIRSFYVDETGVIRAADNRGAMATALDNPLDNESYSSTSPPLRRDVRDY